MAVTTATVTPGTASAGHVHAGVNQNFCRTQRTRFLTSHSLRVEFRSKTGRRNSRNCYINTEFRPAPKPLLSLFYGSSSATSKTLGPCNGTGRPSSLFADTIGSLASFHGRNNNALCPPPAASLPDDFHGSGGHGEIDEDGECSGWKYKIWNGVQILEKWIAQYLLGLFLIQLARDIMFANKNNPWLLPETGDFKWFRWFLNIQTHRLFYTGGLVGLGFFEWFRFLKQWSATLEWSVKLCQNLAVAIMVGGLLHCQTNNYGLELVYSSAIALVIVWLLAQNLQNFAVKLCPKSTHAKLCNAYDDFQKLKHELGGTLDEKNVTAWRNRNSKHLKWVSIFLVISCILEFFIFIITAIRDIPYIISNEKSKWLQSLASYHVIFLPYQILWSIASLLFYPFVTTALGFSVAFLLDVSYIIRARGPDFLSETPKNAYLITVARNAYLITLLHVLSNARYFSFHLGHWLTSRGVQASYVWLFVGCLIFLGVCLINILILTMIAAPGWLIFNTDGQSQSMDHANMVDKHE